LKVHSAGQRGQSLLAANVLANFLVGADNRYHANGRIFQRRP
jgi:hypothetical protein